MKILKLVAVFFLLMAVSQVNAQENVSFLMKKGNKLFKLEQYKNALPFYEKVLEQKPNHADATFKAGACYLHRYSKEKALEYILRAYELDPRVNRYRDFWLGRAYHHNYEFDKALENYQSYKSSLRKTDQRNIDVDKYIRQVNNAKKFVANPGNFQVKNLGSDINTSSSEHSPLTTLNDSTIIFTSRRETPGGKEDLDGEFFEDIFIAHRLPEGGWSKPTQIELNTSNHDASIQLFDNDTKMLLYRNTKNGDIYVTERQGEKWSEPQPFANINTKDFESDAFITADGNTIYFATNHYKQKGDLDIYYIEKQANGSWGRPMEMKGINSNEDEDAPYITPDGKTLYFSSRGHNSMGGYDVFKSTLDSKGNWTTPENLGHPINTPDDDVYYYLSSVESKAYMASYRDGGFGEKDIYEVVPITNVIVKGRVIEDKTGTLVDNVTVVFASEEKKKNTTDEVAAPKGQYNVELLSSQSYKVFVKDADSVLLEERIVIDLISKEGTVIEKDFVVAAKEVKEEDESGEDKPATASTKDYKYIVRIIRLDKSQDLKASQERELELIAELIKKNPKLQLELAGQEKMTSKTLTHLKEKGADISNVKLVNSENANSGVKVNLLTTEELDLNLNPNIVASSAIGKNFILRNVYFGTSSAELNEDSKYELNILAEIMKAYPALHLEVGGHTDSTGPVGLNQKISEARAKSVMSYLVSNGIDGKRLTYKGYGIHKPIADNTTEKGRQLNRRTEVKITKK